MTFAFEKPARSCFNLTHYAKLIPESHAVFVMPAGCSRILRLSAIEEGISHRFTMFNLESTDIISGDVESILIEAACTTIDRLTEENRRPRIFSLFVSCIDSFIGTDHDYVMSELRAFAPDIIFFDLAVDPINRESLPPLVRVHNTVTSLFEHTQQEPFSLWLGSHLPPAADHPLRQRLAERGIPSRHLSECDTVEELRQMGNSLVNVAATAMALPAVRKLKSRFGTPYYNLMDPADPDSLGEEALPFL